MARVANRRLARSAVPVACALAALWPAQANAQADLRLFTPDTLELTGDLRLIAVDGEKGWLDGGFGKLRSGSDGDLRVLPELGNVSLVWQPQFTWSLGATIVGSVQGGDRTEAGLSQAFLSFRPMRGTATAFSARAGLMWPPVSLEHEGADWHVRDSITPSAINSWIGEEVRPVAGEGSIAAIVAGTRLKATGAIIAANDTAGTLLTFRGWAFHDRTTLAFNHQPLPPLDSAIAEHQGPVTHPLIDLHGGFAHRPGFYAKLAWQAPVPLRVELFHYNNRANPEDVNGDHEWGWRTRFDNLGLVSDLGGGATLKAQALSGHTTMGYPIGDMRWVDTDFRSAFVLLTRPFGPFGIAVRGDAFDTRNRGSLVDDEYDETGWSAMIAGKREWGPVTAIVELLHVASTREDREDVGLEPKQDQTQVQAQVRMRW